MKASKILICLLLALSLCLCLVLVSCNDDGDGDITPPPAGEDIGDKKGQIHHTGNTGGGSAGNAEPNNPFDEDETIRS